MKKSLTVWASALALVCALAVPLITPGAASAGQPTAAPGAQAFPNGGRGRHPQMRQAMRALQNARRHLQQGAHDFHGHRARALELTNQAIEECRAALESDRR